MEEKKDFLSQFSGDNKKPDSFKEEVRIPVNKKPVNYKLIGIIAGIVIALGCVGGWLIFRPTITVPDFVGQNKKEISAWVKQQGIEVSGIRVVEEYSLEYDADIVIDQTIAAGSKVRKDVKATFTVSLGGDPEELIRVPDLYSMNRSEIELWIKQNKLQKAKISTAYNSDVAENQVISYEIKNGDESSFKRGTTLNIVVSKGEQPAGTATVTDFRNKSVMEAENWAKTNKINLNKVETFSNNVDSGLIISQSVEPNKTIKEGETLTVYVSKGKGVTVPNFTVMNKKSFDAWKMGDNDLSVVQTEVYSESGSYIIAQSIPAGTMVEMGEKIVLTVNKGDGFYLDDESISFTDSLDRLEDAIKDANDKGLNIKLVVYKKDSAEFRGKILSHSIYTETMSYSDIQKLPLTVTIEVSVSDHVETGRPDVKPEEEIKVPDKESGEDKGETIESEDKTDSEDKG